MTAGNSHRRWYREPMMWLVLGLPAAVVVATIVMVTVALRAGGTDAWPAQVRRTAQVQVEDMRADRAAITMQLRGTLAINADTGAVQVELDNVPPQTLQLHLDLIHPARAAGDASVELVRSGERFLGRLPLPLAPVWAVQVSDPEGTWRVTGRYESGHGATMLAPAFSEDS
ncbi:MAG: FixH family protein [Lysobacteraceae bacterium]